jgi:hypothetical protein
MQKPKRRSLPSYAFIGTLSLGLVFVPRSALADEFKVFDFSILRVPTAMGFFPFGGNARVKSNQFVTYIGGPGFDFFNWTNEHKDIYDRVRRDKITLLNATFFLVGFDCPNWQPYSDKQPSGDACSDG